MHTFGRCTVFSTWRKCIFLLCASKFSGSPAWSSRFQRPQDIPIRGYRGLYNRPTSYGRWKPSRAFTVCADEGGSSGFMMVPLSVARSRNITRRRRPACQKRMHRRTFTACAQTARGRVRQCGVWSLRRVHACEAKPDRMRQAKRNRRRVCLAKSEDMPSNLVLSGCATEAACYP